MDGLKTRLLELIEMLGTTKAQFERIVGLSNGFVDKAGDNTRVSSLDKISIAYPEVNMSWLRTGEGEMLKSGAQQSSTGDYSPNVNGNGNSVNSSLEMSDLCGRFLGEIAEQRKLVNKSQEQIDRLLTIIEQLSKN